MSWRWAVRWAACLLCALALQSGDAKQRSRHHRDSLASTSSTAPHLSPPVLTADEPSVLGPVLDDDAEASDHTSRHTPHDHGSVYGDTSGGSVYLAKQNPCLVKYCGRGRQCVVDVGGAAGCVCQRHCHRRRKPVCGTDGQLYANHCELHRAACLQERAIAVDRVAEPPFRCSGESTSQPPAGPWPHGPNAKAKPATLSSASPVQPPPATPQLDFKNYSWPYLSSADHVSRSALDVERNEGESKDQSKLEEAAQCSIQEYEIMKDNLLLYNHAKLMAEDNRSSGKEYLVSIMFSHYDQNNDGALEREELDQISEKEHLNQLAKGCTLGDMLSYDDSDNDGHLNINEFYMAFSKLYSVSVVSLDKALEVNHLSARVGDNVEIKCDVTGTPPPPIVWRRHGADLASLVESTAGLSAVADGEIRVFSDGSLYLTRIQLVHAGNYTCHAQRNKDVVQTHVLTVHTIPEVKVTPKIQSRRPGEEAAMFCHVVGEPFPKVEWLKNDEPLKIDMPNKYEIIGNGTELQIHNIAYADTGAYMCQATNVGGMTRDISSLVVQEDPTPTAPNEERRFFSFHDWGVSVYEPTACRLYHQIQATDIIPGTQEYVCGDKGVNCSWGQAINVANRYVYVTQPKKDRVLVISKIQMVVVDVVVTDKYPVELHHVPPLDQVWVLNWRSDTNHGIKTIQIIRDAAQKRKHHTVHPEPIDGQFDLVKGLFMPPVQDITHTFKYGYVTHTNQRGLFKLDLANMRYIRSIDLTPYNCVPREIQFSALYGFVVMECEEPVTGRSTGQILLDQLTDTVVSYRSGLFGRPRISPDSRMVVTLDRGHQGVTLVVQEVTENGLKFSFDVKTTLNVSDITFYPSQTTHGYDLYASASDKEDILFLNLVTGKVEMITGVGKAMQPSLAQWDNPNRPIAASGIFGHYMVTPANEALFVVNGETRTVNCEIGGLVHPRSVVWVTMQLQ
ncbi:follistatin-related protein 5-like isoform X3 [Ischnura elegans]|uniref:follistatin-related protein 5-like isoform X3 n=1 Tax=Ischnura elegans TaxID=197161 RepID=UPI001ED8A9EF|nr:follistatin-related protein 5-like isoform X3 [Ischnura elegans]